jgi:hypothetical protein
MLSVGHRTGLFDALRTLPGHLGRDRRPRRTHERYVREWLALVTGECGAPELA